MSWRIKLFELGRERKPVESFLDKLDDSTAAKVFRTLDLLSAYGPKLGMPHSKKVSRQLYELRIRGQIEIRIFYAFQQKSVILLHIFQKKTQKIPPRELDTAEERFGQLK